MLTAMILLPVLAAALILWLGEEAPAPASLSAAASPAALSSSARASAVARAVALGTTLLLLAMGLFLWSRFDSATAAFQFVERYELFGGLFSWHLGLDGISLVLILLSVFLMPLCILAGWDSIATRVPQYLAAFLVMEALMIGVFSALDILLFYIFFESGLIPMYLIIGIWGGARRVYASYKFFLFTLAGSVLMLLAILWMVRESGTTDVPALMAFDFPVHSQTWLWLAFFASFAVKVPMWPVHTWLPDAHVEAPTAGSMILAGVLLKMGGYGFIRFSIPMFPEASVALMGIVFALSMVAVVYTSLVALAQSDMKKLIAYSSVAHMAFVTGGLFAFNAQGIEGAMVVMISHGLVSAALFFCVGVLYERLHTREIGRYGGLAATMPRYALFFMLFTMASIALPGTSGFVGEFLALLGMFQTSTWLGVVMTTGIILGAAYMLWLYARVVFGEIVHADAGAMPDLAPREWAVLLLLALSVLAIGVYPKPLMAPLKAPVASLVARLERAQAPSVPVARPAGAPAKAAATAPAGAPA